MEIPIDVGRPIYSDYAGQRQLVARVVARVQLSMQAIDVPLEYSSYEQIDVDGTLAWAAVAKANLDDEYFQLKLCFVPQDDGRFAVTISAAGSSRDGYLGVPETLITEGVGPDDPDRADTSQASP